MTWQLQMCAILTALNVYIWFTVQPPKGHPLRASLLASFVVAAFLPVALAFGWVAP